jgi:DNA-binding transcriptional LysR family regulator
VIQLDVLSSDVLVPYVAEGRVDTAVSDIEPNHAGVRVEPFRASRAVCATAGVQPRLTIETATVVSAAELVREGKGIALINPCPTVLRLDPSLITRRFEPAITLQASFLMPVGARLSPPARAFMAKVRLRAKASPTEDD